MIWTSEALEAMADRASARVNDPDDRADCRQEAWLKAWTYTRRTPEAAEKQVLTTMLNAMIDFLRRSRVQQGRDQDGGREVWAFSDLGDPRAVERVAAADAEAATLAAMEAERLLALMDSPAFGDVPLARPALLLMAQGRSRAQAAAEMGVAPKQLSNAVYHGRKKMARLAVAA